MQNYMKGIRIDGKHTWADFRAMLASSSKPFPTKQIVTATIPYSNIEPDFSEIYGKTVYNKRDVSYRFKFYDNNPLLNLKRCEALANWLYSLDGEKEIFDDYEPTHHFIGKCTNVEYVSTVGEEFGAIMISVTFRCEPYKKTNGEPAFVVSSEYFPDIDDDGEVTASDAAEILEAAARIGSGQESGLTPEQEKKADADRDGKITSEDAALVNEFAAAVGARGQYDNSPSGWAEFLNNKFHRLPDVL